MQSVTVASLQAQWVDLAMLGWLALSVLIGMLRGLVFEVVSLLGWGVAYFGASWALPMLVPMLPSGLRDAALRHGVAFLCAFTAILLVWGVAARLLRLLVRSTPLSLPDRVLGAGFGLLRGLLVLLLVVALVGLTPMVASPDWQRSRLAAWLNGALLDLKPLLPDELSFRLPA